MRDTRSFLLLTLSIGLIGTWSYHLYDKTVYTKQKHEIYIKDSVAVAEGVHDSLQKIYSATINALDLRLNESRTNADSLKSALNTNISEIHRLKNEIGGILKNRGATRADMDLAKRKIGELQGKIDDLRDQNESMEEEKKRLTGILDQLNTDLVSLEENVKRLGEENKTLADKVNNASVFVASELRLSPVTQKNFKEAETSQAKKASKLVVSFVVQNYVIDQEEADVNIVIIQPDGKVLQDPSRDQGQFDTRTEGRKTYSLRLKFFYDKGEPKQVLFSLSPEKFQKGKYTLQVYHKGIRIGQVSKTLD